MIYAMWVSESLDFDAKPVGEQWSIGEDRTKEREALCALAGTMPLHSPILRNELSTKVRSHSDNAWRWVIG